MHKSLFHLHLPSRSSGPRSFSLGEKSSQGLYLTLMETYLGIKLHLLLSMKSLSEGW